MPSCTGIGGVGRETGIGNTITGEGRKMKGTTEWHPRLENERTVDFAERNGSTVDFAERNESTVDFAEAKESMVDFTGKADTRKDIRSSSKLGGVFRI